MRSGFILLAHKSPAYVRMAFNMALSIRAAGSVLPIAIISDETTWNAGITGKKEKFWKSLIRIPYPDNIPNVPFYAKTRLFDLSPFDRSIFIDCDGLCLKNPDELFDKVPFPGLMVTRAGFKGDDRYCWAPGEAVQKFYGIPDERQWLETNSSMIAFDRSKHSRDMFTIAEELYACRPYPKWKGTVGFYPDELAFNSAISIVGIQPVITPAPIGFIKPSGSVPNFAKLRHDYYFLGLYGTNETTHLHAWDFYNRELQAIARKMIQDSHFKVSVNDKAQSQRGQRRYEPLRKNENTEVANLINEYLHGNAG